MAVEDVPEFHYLTLWVRDLERDFDRLLLTELNKLGKHGWDLVAVNHDRAYFKRPIHLQHLATHSRLTIGGPMPGSITVDTSGLTVLFEFEDDKGDTDAAAPSNPSGAAVVTFTSATPAATVATDPANPLLGDISLLSEGPVTLGATLAYPDGSPVTEADGVTPFPTPATQDFTVTAGLATGSALLLSPVA